MVWKTDTNRNEQNTGGWFVCWQEYDSSPTFGLPVGVVPSSKIRNYVNFATEKAYRLHQHLREKNVSSWQTRDVSDPDAMKHKYGGAILCGDEFGQFIFSFSGMPEHADEALCTMTAHELHLLTEDQIRAIVAISDNPILKWHYNL